MAFRYIVTDLAGTQQGELANASDRTVRLAFNGRRKTATTRIRVDNPLADFLIGGTALIKVYDASALLLVAELASYEETSDGSGGSIALNFSDAWGRFADRLLGKTATGYTDGTALAPVDKTTLIANMVTAANAPGYTGVTLNTLTNTGATSYAALTPYSPADVAITNIINNLDGPDVELVACEPAAVAGGTRIAYANVVPTLGTNRPNAVFEYAIGRRNVAAYTRAGDLSLLLNSGFILPPSSNAAGAVLTASDATSQTTYLLREGVVSGGDLDVDAMRQQLVNEHVRVRKNPRVLVRFTPTRDDPAYPGRVPRFGVDYFLGDTVPFRAVNPRTGAVRVNASLRVYAIDYTVDDNGAATPTLSLTAD